MSTLSPHPGPSCGPRSIFTTITTHILQFWLADIISAVEFDSTGNYLATGDKGGRVVLFERNDMVRPAPLWPLYRRSLISHLDLSVGYALF